MTSRDNNTGWGVLAGIMLIGLGLWLLLGGLFEPVARVIAFLGRVGWPLLLVGLGILLILRARGGGFNVNGKKLYRSRTNRMIGGVMGGVAEYMGVDATVLRVIYAFLSLFTGIWWGFLLYILAMIIVPEQPYPAGWVPAPAPPVPAPPAPAPPAPPAPPMPQSGFVAPEPPQAPTPPAQPSAYEPPTTPTAAPAVPEPPAVPSDPMTPPEAPQVPPAPPVL
ncbi:MAG: PspC domain-containing protein [Coriobacteriia bacterium]|nr:PspC domain-containing protein [Coriobacteriia bacterium]